MTYIDPLELQARSLALLNQAVETGNNDVLLIREASYWLEEAQQTLIPKMLFGKFWYQDEVCILFADSNLGKSILAVQIADAITRGFANAPFEVEAPAQPVIYCDFELTEKQFEARYSKEYTNHYPFNNKFLRAKINPDIELPNHFSDFDEYLINNLERGVIQTGAKVLVIDNITYLRSETEQAADALPLMKQLKNLKNKYGLSMLVLAHTPKRDLTQPITRNDLQGSKMLMNFCDSAFTIGESSTQPNMRYLKQIKQRNTEQVYGENNVCLCCISKPYNFLQYEFVDYGQEWQQLMRKKPAYDAEMAEQAVKLRDQNYSLREIGKELNISHQKADRLIKAASN